MRECRWRVAIDPGRTAARIDDSYYGYAHTRVLSIAATPTVVLLPGITRPRISASAFEWAVTEN